MGRKQIYGPVSRATYQKRVQRDKKRADKARIAEEEKSEEETRGLEALPRDAKQEMIEKASRAVEEAEDRTRKLCESIHLSVVGLSMQQMIYTLRAANAPEGPSALTTLDFSEESEWHIENLVGGVTVIPLKTLVATGSFGKVFVCARKGDPAGTRTFAVKVPKHNNENSERTLLHEFMVMVGLVHSCINPLDPALCGYIEGIFVIGMMCGIDTLNYLLQKSMLSPSTLPPMEPIFEVAILQVIFAVDYLHARSIVHHDLKLENVIYFICDGVYSFKLIDFGSARFGMDIDALERTSRIPCGPSVYAPLHERVYKGKSYDVYCLGVLFYYLYLLDPQGSLDILQHKFTTGGVDEFENPMPDFTRPDFDIATHFSLLHIRLLDLDEPKRTTVMRAREAIVGSAVKNYVPNDSQALCEITKAMVSALPNDRPSIEHVRRKLARSSTPLWL